MNHPIPLIPHKHIRFSSSILALSGLVRTYLLDRPQTLDELWVRLQSLQKDHAWVKDVTFTGLVLAIDILFSIGEIESLKDDYIRLKDVTCEIN